MRKKFFILLFCFGALFYGNWGKSASQLPLTVEVNPEDLAREITAVFEAGACGYVMGSRLGYPVISVACESAYSEQHRTAVLDRIFRRGVRLDYEDTAFAPYNGSYFYSFSYRTLTETKRLYVKLHFRNSPYLYKNTQNAGRIAILIDELDNVADLIRWQSLGLKLSYAVIPFKEDSAELAARIRDYRQGLFLSLSLKPLDMSPDIATALTVADVIEQGLLQTYVKRAVDALNGVDGVSDRNSREFFKNLPALRLLFAELKNNGVNYFFDTARNPGMRAVDTGRVMGLSTSRADIYLKTCSNKQDIADKLVRLAKNKTTLAVVIAANNSSCYAAFKRAQKKFYRYNTEFILLGQTGTR